MAILTPTQISRVGVLETLAAATVTGDVLPNTGKEFITINNGSGTTLTVTLPFASTVNVDTVDPTDRTVSILAGARKIMGPFPPSLYSNASGQVAINYSAVTDVTVGAFKLVPETN